MRRYPGEVLGDQLSPAVLQIPLQRRRRRRWCRRELTRAWTESWGRERPLSPPALGPGSRQLASTPPPPQPPLGLLHLHGAAPPLHVAPPLQLVQYAAAHPRSPPCYTASTPLLHSTTPPLLLCSICRLPAAAPTPSKSLVSPLQRGWMDGERPPGPWCLQPALGPTLPPAWSLSAGSAKRLLLLLPPRPRRRPSSCPPRNPDGHFSPEPK
ncbi:unnamed protein product [Arctogadus glacialis]